MTLFLMQHDMADSGMSSIMTRQQVETGSNCQQVPSSDEGSTYDSKVSQLNAD